MRVALEMRLTQIPRVVPPGSLVLMRTAYIGWANVYT